MRPDRAIWHGLNVNPERINCKTTADWKAALEQNLKKGEEVSLLNFDCTDENTALCKSIAKSYRMVLRANAATGSAHFFKE